MTYAEFSHFNKEVFYMSKKIRKPPSMPYWYWLDTDNCWFCNNRNNCNNCSIIKKYRKKYFPKKEKGKYN